MFPTAFYCNHPMSALSEYCSPRSRRCARRYMLSIILLYFWQYVYQIIVGTNFRLESGSFFYCVLFKNVSNIFKKVPLLLLLKILFLWSWGWIYRDEYNHNKFMLTFQGKSKILNGLLLSFSVPLKLNTHYLWWSVGH